MVGGDSATYGGADAETVNNAVATPVAQSVMGVERHALPADHERQRRFDGHAGDLRHRVPIPTSTPSSRQNNVITSTAARLPATVTKQGVTTQQDR
ncbi:MAG: hypothetical protein ACLRSE_11595 [Alistipes finegoldii]